MSSIQNRSLCADNSQIPWFMVHFFHHKRWAITLIARYPLVNYAPSTSFYDHPTA